MTEGEHSLLTAGCLWLVLVIGALVLGSVAWEAFQ